MKWYKKLIALAALFVFVFTGIAAIEEPAGEFKNLQVLPKNITPDSLDRIMGGFNDGLGVNCTFCHTENKNTKLMEAEKDTKPEKEITRNMMRMTMDINKNYFQFNENVNAKEVQAVTCYTCHKGQPIPEKVKKPATKDPFNFKSN
ncbi:MAG: c-type cytochrome [Chitinophagaceae bacterium]|nr:c-type cytochrome [Chitinophagaceae bacterium]